MKKTIHTGFPTIDPAVTHAEQMIRNAEASRAQILGTPGKDKQFPADLWNSEGNDTRNKLELNNFLHSAMVDEDYLAIGAHVDETLQKKIISNEYVDFARLLPRDRLAVEEDHRMEMVNKDGMSYWVPVADRDNLGAISSFSKWEQAFRVFSNIYNSKFPERATELVQYNHIIHTASQMYVWDNVYQYDKEFRLHISRHP